MIDPTMSRLRRRMKHERYLREIRANRERSTLADLAVSIDSIIESGALSEHGEEFFGGILDGIEAGEVSVCRLDPSMTREEMRAALFGTHLIESVETFDRDKATDLTGMNLDEMMKELRR